MVCKAAHKHNALSLPCRNDEEWYRLRSAVQQLMLRPKEVVPFLPGVDSVTLDFVTHLKRLRNHSSEVPDFATELSQWLLECRLMFR